MKKLYVFLNRRICGVDGSIQYIYNKSEFLRTKGYDVVVFSVHEGKIIVEDFKKYKPYIIPEMQYCPSMYLQSKQNKVLKLVISKINYEKGDEVIIESTSPISAVWGEIIAHKLRCKHIFFHLLERTDINRDMRDFCSFKYLRGELAGITKNTVPLLLENEKAESCKITACCSNVFSNCVDNFSSCLNRKADYTFGSIGRLEKPCVPIIAKGILDYIKKNSHLRFNVVFIGGSSDEKTEKWLKSIFKKCDNVTLVITGYLYPIPLSLVEHVDLFVSTAGAATATYRLGIPTIKVHPILGEPLGIIGCDINLSTSMLEMTDKYILRECIDRILFEDLIIDEESNPQSENYELMMRQEFLRQLNIALNKNTTEYYDVNKLDSIETSFVRFRILLKIMNCIFGFDSTHRIKRIVKYIKEKWL